MAIAAPNPDLTTSQLAQRTGLAPGTLRVWERRHGFPVPARLPGGHRRYSDRDVELVREVCRLRDQGLSLPAAIERAARPAPLATSLFAGVRRRHPELSTTVLPEPAVLALTRAIEDEHLARAATGGIVGSFQRQHFYRRSQSRWRELARTAALAVALADFPALADPPGEPVELPVGPRDPQLREWAIIVGAGDLQACLVAWERPDGAGAGSRPGNGGAGRTFEVVWSFDPAVVASAIEVAVEIIDPLAPGLGRRLRESVEIAPASPEPILRAGGALTRRMVGYLCETLGADGASAPDTAEPGATAPGSDGSGAVRVRAR